MRQMLEMATDAEAAGEEARPNRADGAFAAPPNLGRDYSERFAAVYRDLARQFDIPLYPFFLAGAVGQSDMMQSDGIHPNARGIELIVARIAPHLADWVKMTGS